MALSYPVAPMKATLGSLPHDDGAWAYEVKYDGHRTIALVEDGAVRLHSTNLIDVSGRYPELAGLASGVNARRAILDGELAVLDDDGRPRFELIQRHERPAVFYVFDVLSIDEHDTIGLALADRRRLLEQVVEPGPAWIVSGQRPGGGPDLVAATEAQGLEGVMAKRLTSTYRPGLRSPDWRKIKHRRRLEVVIGGFRTGTGNRASTFGSLLVGRPDGDGGLVFAGGIGTGFDQPTLELLTGRLRDLAVGECPFDTLPPPHYRRNATWVEPVLTAVVEMTELTNDGLIRHGSFVRLLADGRAGG